MKRITNTIVIFTVIMFVTSGICFAKTAGDYITPPEGKTVNDPIHKYSSLTYKELQNYMDIAESKETIMQNGAYQVNVTVYFLKMMQNANFGNRLIRNIKPNLAKGKFKTAILNAKFMKMMFVDVGNMRAAKEMHQKLKEVVKFAARSELSIKEIKTFVRNIDKFYNNNFDIPEAPD